MKFREKNCTKGYIIIHNWLLFISQIIIPKIKKCKLVRALLRMKTWNSTVSWFYGCGLHTEERTKIAQTGQFRLAIQSLVIGISFKLVRRSLRRTVSWFSKLPTLPFDYRKKHQLHSIDKNKMLLSHPLSHLSLSIPLLISPALSATLFRSIPLSPTLSWALWHIRIGFYAF